MTGREGIDLSAMCLTCRKALYTGMRVATDYAAQEQDMRDVWDRHQDECEGPPTNRRPTVIWRGRRPT